MEEENIILIKQIIRSFWIKIGIDTPRNIDEIDSFIIEDVKVSSSYLSDGYFHNGDIEIAFRRFIESK